MGREFELKYAATAETLSALAEKYPGGQVIAMETTYYDTADHALSARHMTLRLRRENRVCICTLKMPLADGSRGEWECHASTIGEGIAALAAQNAPGELSELTKNGVIAVCGAKFTRIARTIPIGDGLVELALDQGALLGGGKQMPLCEVEVELKSGPDQAAIAFATALAAEYGLKPQSESKFRRAMALAEGE